MAGHAVRYTTYQEAFKAFSPVRAKYDQVRMPLFGNVNDSRLSVSLFKGWRHGKTRGAQLGDSFFDQRLALLPQGFPEVLELRIVLDHFEADQMRRGLHDMQDPHFGVLRSRLRKNRLDSRFREF